MSTALNSSTNNVTKNNSGGILSVKGARYSRRENGELVGGNINTNLNINMNSINNKPLDKLQQVIPYFPYLKTYKFFKSKLRYLKAGQQH
jgi:hypothetical protein